MSTSVNSKVSGIATGDVLSDGSVPFTGAIATTVGTFTSSVANGAAAKAFSKNTVALTTTAKIESWANNSVEKAFIQQDGALTTLGIQETGGSVFLTGQPPGINLKYRVRTGILQGSTCLTALNNNIPAATLWSAGLVLASGGYYSFDSSTSSENNGHDTRAYRGAAGRWDFCTISSSSYGDIKLRNLIVSAGLIATDAAAPTVASATTIAPTKYISFVSGTAAIATITAPAPIASGGGQITLIPTGIFTTTTSGNIALASTAVVSRALIMTYDTTTGKWYPSY